MIEINKENSDCYKIISFSSGFDRETSCVHKVQMAFGKEH